MSLVSCVVGGWHVLQNIFLSMKSMHFGKRNTLRNSFKYISFPVMILGGHPLDITREKISKIKLFGVFWHCKPVAWGLQCHLVDSSGGSPGLGLQLPLDLF